MEFAKRKIPDRLDSRAEVLEFICGFERPDYGDEAWFMDLAYRGVPDSRIAGLLPAIARQNKAANKRSYVARKESELLDRFSSMSAALIGRKLTAWENLSLARHYGVPTRILDWTLSPLVALHFAVPTMDLDTEPAIWCADYTSINLHAIRWFEHLGVKPEEEFNHPLSIYDLEAIAPDLEGFSALAPQADRPDRFEIAVFFSPPNIDPRISNQSALFSLSTSPTVDLEEWNAEGDEHYLVKKIVIGNSMIPFIRDLLDKNRINELHLFPGLDAVGSYLARGYFTDPNLRMKKWAHLATE